MTTSTSIVIKRVYELPEKKDGFRVLVDRLWPRGLTKEAARIDEWAKDLAPSPALRTWFGHDPEKWKQFSREYLKELEQSPTAAPLAYRLLEHKKLTLVYGAKDTAHTHALVLLQFMQALPG